MTTRDEDNNPLNTPLLPRGLLPEPHSDDLRAIRYRALQLLKNRSPEELAAAASGVSVMLKAGEEELIDEIMERVDAEESDRATRRFGAPHTLKLYMEVYDITGQPDFPAARWSEYFAVLALHRFRYIVAWAKESFERTAEQVDPAEVIQASPAQVERLAQCLPLILDALEAVVTGEQLAEAERLRGLVTRDYETRAKRKRSLQASRAAHERHAPLDQLKRECIQFYLENRPPSFSQGAERFWRTVDEARKAELSLRDPIRTLTQALSRYKNGTLPKRICP